MSFHLSKFYVWVAKLQKKTSKSNFFAKKFAQFRKTYYLCTRKRENERTFKSESPKLLQ